MDKNRRISALQDKIAVLDYDSRKKSEEISRLTKELEVLRGCSNGSITSALRRCMVKSSKQSHSSDMDIVEKMTDGIGEVDFERMAVNEVDFEKKCVGRGTK
ncbi:hypothetical protein R6Q57_013469 [Mikania cordata]